MSNALPGLIIEGKYRLLSPLGAGAMGAVWLAEQISVDRKVAIKLLHPNASNTSGMNERFAIEAKAIARLNHPNCITLFDFGFAEELDSYFTVIEYVKGEPLGKRLLNIMSIRESIEIVRQVAQGLDHAHFHNILHRDLKPDNIMLTVQSDGQEILKILDFGIAKIVNGKFGEENDDEIRLTRTGDVFGTPAYMSPEQARASRSLTPASDFYALGVIFFEMIEGELPFTASSSFDVLMMQVTDEVPRLRREHLPPEIAEVIYKLLEKHPDDRFQSGKDIIDALSSIDFEDLIEEVEGESVGNLIPHASIETEHFFASEDPTIPPASSPLTITEDRKKRGRKSPFIFIFPVVAIFALIIFFTLQKEDNQEEKKGRVWPVVETHVPVRIEKKSALVPIEDEALKLDPSDENLHPKIKVETPEKTPRKIIPSQEKTRKATKKTRKPKKEGKIVNEKLQLIKDPGSKVKKLGL